MSGDENSAKRSGDEGTDESDDEDFSWICGNENLSHRRLIGHGGFGEVHEVSVNLVTLC
jgi:hypothetical protein